MTLHAFGRSLAAVAAAVLVTACANDLPLAPNGSVRPSPTSGSPRPVGVIVVGDGEWEDAKAPELGGCANLAAPAGTKLASRAYAKGYQVYRWDGLAWVFVAPDAELFADANHMGRIGTHYAGPIWESTSGSTVKAALVDKCPVGAADIPWLILGATANAGPGPFAAVTHIQRLNTVGGVVPADAGSAVGEVRKVPYTAEYYFYRAR